jgi:hypothetical protein
MLSPDHHPFDMPGEHPFQQLFETFGKLPAAHSDSVNREAREALKGWLASPAEKPGHCILLKAPRAGHGKTHLLTKLQHDLGGTHEFIPLHAVGGSRIDATTVLDDTLRRLVRSLPAAGGLTVLDLVARRLFSSSLQPLVNSGEVPCQDREGALAALRTRPIETFDFHHPSAVTAHWARENFELLGPRLALELSQKNNLPLREVSFWVDAMFRFAATAIDNPGRTRALAATVFDAPTAGSAAHERLVALLGLMGSLMRVVLVADELEGFSSDEAAALRFASFLGSLRQSVERADVILSVNQDVWESAFLPRLSGGLADRLSEVTVELSPLGREGILAILESRSPGMGEKILATMATGDLPSYARGVIKSAAEGWGLEPASVVEPEPEPEPAAPAEFVAPVHEPDPIPIPETSPVSAPVEVPVVSEDPPTEPTNFSPEAAITAFNANQSPFEETPQPPSEPAILAPESEAKPAESAIVAPATDFAVPPVTAEPKASSPRPVDSPFQIDTGADPAVQAFQADPASLEPEGAGDEPAPTDRVDSLLKQFRERYGKQ